MLVKVDVPMLKELSTAAVWPVIKDLEDVRDYFPDLKEKELPDREFMWNVLNTLKPVTTQTLINDSLKNRGLDNEENQEDMVEIAPEYLEKLMKIASQKVET